MKIRPSEKASISSDGKRPSDGVREQFTVVVGASDDHDVADGKVLAKTTNATSVMTVSCDVSTAWRQVDDGYVDDVDFNRDDVNDGR